MAATLVHKVVGDRLHCVFVDNGLLRRGERKTVESLYRRNFHIDVRVVDASAPGAKAPHPQKSLTLS